MESSLLVMQKVVRKEDLMKSILFAIVFAINLFLVSSIYGQYYHAHQHNGVWHQHPHSAAHYHDNWGTIYYPPVTTYRGTGIWSYSPGAIVTPNRNVIIQYSGGYWYYTYPNPCYRMPYRWR